VNRFNGLVLTNPVALTRQDLSLNSPSILNVAKVQVGISLEAVSQRTLQILLR
jgi:hypothetical protein